MTQQCGFLRFSWVGLGVGWVNLYCDGKGNGIDIPYPGPYKAKSEISALPCDPCIHSKHFFKK